MEMDPHYVRLRERARQIVSRYPQADFYKDYPEACRASRHLFETDATTARLRQFVSSRLENNMGHGLSHAVKVTLDAGALMQIEGQQQGYATPVIQRCTRSVQCAGLLHDIRRKLDDHAVKGARHARDVLKNYPFSPSEIDDICSAIRNHEAFRKTVIPATARGALISDCLYDADKFRWGPDNFTHTLWAMVAFYNPPLARFIDRYPKGMRGLARIKATFRTLTGKKYGPQFIDLGIAIGEELYQVILEEFAGKVEGISS